MKHYVIHVIGCTDPCLHGPYASRALRDLSAHRTRNGKENGGREEDAVFWLDIDNQGPLVGSYSAGFMEADEPTRPQWEPKRTSKEILDEIVEAFPGLLNDQRGTELDVCGGDLVEALSGLLEKREDEEDS